MEPKDNWFDEVLPKISCLDVKSLSSPLTYIGAAGFEDRAPSFLKSALSEKIRIDNAILIKYAPFEKKNRIDEFRDLVNKLEIHPAEIIFNRYDPQIFSKLISDYLPGLKDCHILIDISGMSKFLIMILLNSLKNCSNQLTIVYTEAKIYHPTKDEFEIEKQKLAKMGGMPDFLTTDVYKVRSVSSLSSVSMQGFPILMIAFPTFNHFELVALYNETSPKLMILLEGLPHEKKDFWRLQAIREINEQVTKNRDYTTECIELSTFDYSTTIKTLEKVYEQYTFTRKILLAPTGSKLQTVAAFMFRLLHPDVHIVYPVTKQFKIGEYEYSEGCKAIWGIHIGDFSKFASCIADHRKVI